ncbi:hypothetical protein [Acinetobacter baumannii]|uniref:hypothetical protein n=2 Tax=Acinetobacter baumannii TaxID=470 RepID=UPI001C05BC20|nr:hypothetical protein [Acinetobacter baumannii]
MITNQYTEAVMNLKQWQRSKKIKAEAEAAAKRTIERVLNAVKEPAMSEFNDIDMPTLPKPIGSLQELHPEFAKVLNENFLELLGDDFPIENHISPHCKTIGEQS